MISVDILNLTVAKFMRFGFNDKLLNEFGTFI